ncbi:hypothetical protein N9D80_00025 [Flavobacteriales bacterium]|nr:hypothetical protein [Flavobacteriales bacterium]
MKTLFNILLLSLICFPVYSQENTFRSKVRKPFKETFTNTSTCDTDTTHHIAIATRLYSITFVEKTDVSTSYLVGATLTANIRNKISFVLHNDYLGGNHNSLFEEFKDSLNVIPFFGDSKKRFQFNLKYKLNKFVVTDIGKGRHFIGNGYRSLLLSDNQTPYPFLKLTTEFGRVKYYNLYTTFLNPNQSDFGRKKHSTIHFLDFAVTDNIHFGVFESILWQSKSEEVNKGFEFAYLNPIIFYRPVEFSKHSSKGNALMGANFNATFNTTVIYGQAMLDDLNISRQKDSNEDNYEEGFFQNKFGFQIGIKTKYQGVNLLAEYNQVQPYTYGHRTILQNYSHMNQALSHPLGANFKEVVLMANYKKDKWKYSIKVTTAKIGLDSLGTHYGQNIFESDYDASTGGQLSYGNFNGQGVLTQLNTLHAEVSYKYKGFDIFGSVFYKSKKSDLLDQTSLFYSVGLRTFPFSTFTDY